MLPYWPWWAWVVVAVALGWGLVLGWALGRLKRWRELHHGYYGLLLAAAALPLAVYHSAWWLLPAAIGVWWLIDDARAHARQVRDPAYWRLAQTLAPGTRGGLDAKYSRWHRWARRWGLI